MCDCGRRSLQKEVVFSVFICCGWRLIFVFFFFSWLSCARLASQLKQSHEQSTGELQHRLQVLTSELNQYAAREPEYVLVQKQTQGKLDRAEIEVKRLTRQYEAARRKAEFLETQATGATHAGGMVQPLQPSMAIMNQATGGNRNAGAPSHLQPIPVAQSLLPPSFAKKV